LRVFLVWANSVAAAVSREPLTSRRARFAKPWC
jgi:hypothetical protein